MNREYRTLRRAGRRAAWLALVLLLLTACERQSTLHYYQSFSDEGWSALEPLTFTVDTLAQGGAYDLSIGIRVTDHYPYRNMWIEVTQQWENPRMWKTDTLKCYFTDEDGEFLGGGVATHPYEVHLDRGNRTAGQCGRIRIRHLMRREMLQGVSDIGIRLSPASAVSDR